nr:MAG TPA_asm: endonuclease [Caudoviricetes sp.]
MKTKITKESRNLLIALLLGDGTISNNNVFKLSHCEEQRDYLEWKIEQLKDAGLRNNGLKEYISVKGYNKGKKVYYTQLNIIPFVKVLRRVFYKPNKKLGNRKLLNRLDAKGIAIWYMDDGHINYRKTNGKVHGFYIKIATCMPKEELQIIIDYFKEVWNIDFYMFHEGKKENSYSLCCGTKEGIKFIDIVKPYVKQIPSMLHKIQYDLSQRTHAV